MLTALYRELMAMPDSAVTDGVQEMRTIIVIDEAHHFLKDKKLNAILERLIREIHSKDAFKRDKVEKPRDKVHFRLNKVYIQAKKC